MQNILSEPVTTQNRGPELENQKIRSDRKRVAISPAGASGTLEGPFGRCAKMGRKSIRRGAKLSADVAAQCETRVFAMVFRRFVGPVPGLIALGLPGRYPRPLWEAHCKRGRLFNGSHFLQY